MDFLPPLPSVYLPTSNSSSCSKPILQSPQTSSQSPCTPVNTRPSLGHVGPWYAPSAYFSLCPVCHRSATSPSSDSLKCFPSVPIEFPVREGVSPNSGISPLLQLPCPRVQVLSCFLSSSFFFLFSVIPSYAGIFIVLSSVQGLLLVFSWCSVRIVASIDIFLIHPWREMHSVSTYSSAILNLSFFLKAE